MTNKLDNIDFVAEIVTHTNGNKNKNNAKMIGTIKLFKHCKINNKSIFIDWNNPNNKQINETNIRIFNKTFFQYG